MVFKEAELPRTLVAMDGFLMESDCIQAGSGRVMHLTGACLALIENSANGKVVVPKDSCRFEPVTGVSFEFKNGKLENFKAEKGAECFNQTMAP